MDNMTTDVDPRLMRDVTRQMEEWIADYTVIQQGPPSRQQRRAIERRITKDVMKRARAQ